MKRVRVAIVGSGFMGGAHLDALRRVERVDVVAIVSDDTPVARALADRHGIDRVLTDWRELEKIDVDAVHNTTPNHLHFEINRGLLGAGKHVVSEKPLTLTSSESAELVRLARDAGVMTAVNFNYRGYPLVQEARDMVSRGALGRLLLVHGHYLQDWLLKETDVNWRIESRLAGASRAIADIGSHWCDLVQFVTGQRITRVFAKLFRAHEERMRDGRPVRIDTEDGACMVIELEGGVVGSLTVSQVSAGRKNRQWLEVDGATAAVSWDQEEPNELWIGHRDRPNESLLKDPSMLSERARAFAHYPAGHPEGYPDGPRNLFDSFYAHVRGEASRPPVFATFEDGHRAVCVVEAALRSDATSGWVSVEYGL